ncbi:MAG: hypothetical protein AAFP90_05290 [Planctomycetota bacterium]
MPEPYTIWENPDQQWALARPLPVWMLILLVIGLLGVSLLAYWYRRPVVAKETKRGSGVGITASLWALRFALFLLLLVVFMAPIQTRYETSPPVLTVILDQSSSMRQSSANDGHFTRQALAQSLCYDDGALFDSVSDGYRVNAIDLRNAPVVDPVLADGKHSPIGDTLQHLQFGVDDASVDSPVVLISDGVVNQGSSLSAVADNLSASSGDTSSGDTLQTPIFAVTVGNHRPPADLALGIPAYATRALAGDQVELTVRVNAVGVDAASIRLIDEDTQRVMANAPLRFSVADDADATFNAAVPTRSLPVRMTFTAANQGLQNVRIVVDGPTVDNGSEGSQAVVEENTENNSQSIRVTIDERPIRVLLVQDGPSYEFRFLNHLLQRTRLRDPDTSQNQTARNQVVGNQESVTSGRTGKPMFELTSVLQNGDRRYSEQEPTASALPPIRAETLQSIDVVIFSDADVRQLGATLLDNVAVAVREHGTGVIFIAGMNNGLAQFENTVMADLMPLQFDRRYSASRSDVDLGFRKTLQTTGLASSFSGLRRFRPQQTSEITVGPAGDSASLLTLPGVFFVLPFGPPAVTARVLATTSMADGSVLPVLVTHRVGKGTAWMQMTDEIFRMQSSGKDPRDYKRYWIELLRQMARTHREATDPPDPMQDPIEPPSVDRQVRTSDEEWEDRPIPSNVGGMQRIADATAGRSWQLTHPDDVTEVAREIAAALPQPTPRRGAEQESHPLMQHPAVYLMIAGLLAGEWLLRRRRGMV